MPCPFLARFPSNFIRNYGTSTLINFSQHCPVMSRKLSSGAEIADSPVAESINSKCPFLSNQPRAVKEANPAMEEDIIHVDSDSKEENKYQYEKFFHDQIMQKKKDHSYRYKHLLKII